MDQLIPIGQFSALTALSPKALRIYHENGLLEPASVNSATGYRYYDPSQVEVAARISLLRRAGIALAEIAVYLEDGDQARVDRWRLALQIECAERQRLLDHLTTTQAQENLPMTAEPTSTTLERAIPVLASLDLEQTQQFYAEKLGFAPLFAYPDYAISGRDDVQIHFWLTDDRRYAENTSCRIDVVGVDALYAEMSASGVVHPNGHLRDQPWGMREFSVLDGDGNLIKFGQQIAVAHTGA